MEDDPALPGPPGCQDVLAVPSRAAALDAVVGAVRGGEAVTVLTAEGGAGKTALLDAAAVRLAPEVHSLRLGNPLSGPLTLERLLIQFGGGAQDSSDAGEFDAMFRALRARVGSEDRVLVAVEEAETLEPRALLFLGMLPTLRAAGLPRLQVLLAGGPELAALLAQERFQELRGRVGTRVTLGPRGAEEAEAASGTPQVVPFGKPAGAAARRPDPRNGTEGRPRRGRVRARTAGIAFLAACAALALVAAVAGRSGRGPSGQGTLAQGHGEAPAGDGPQLGAAAAAPVGATGSPAEAASPAPASADGVSAEQAAAAAPGPAQSQVPALSQPAPPGDAAQAERRREFEAFLDRQGGASALLSPAQRAELFQEYLAWRGRLAHTPPASPPEQAALPPRQ